jgi:hypothetical protein
MRRIVFFVLIVILAVPLLFLQTPFSMAASDLTPLVPSQVNILVVSPDNIYHKGGSYLIADLTRYGFNVTQSTSDDAVAADYINDPKASNLMQYQVVILQGGSVGFPPALVSLDEVDHFVNYGGILVVIGDSLFRDEATNTWWNTPDPFSSAPIQRLDQRLGVEFTSFFGNVEGAPYWENNGTFARVSTLVRGLPPSLQYHAPNPSSVFQLDLTTPLENRIYDFTSTSGTGGKSTAGVTFYRNSTGAVGIYIQGSYIYAQETGVNQIEYFGLTEISSRARMLASLIAYGLGRDVETIIKPQPLATIRLGNLGGYGLTSGLLQDDAYLDASLAYFDSVVDDFGIVPTITFTDQPDFKTDYWQTVAQSIPSQLKGGYRDWEYSSSLRNQNVSSMTSAQIEALVDGIKANLGAMGFDLFATVIAPRGYWNNALLSAMANRNLTLLDVPDSLDQEWNVHVNSTVIVHRWSQMAGEAIENFTQMDRNALNFQYYGSRDKWALATVNGFPEFVYDIRNFRFDQVGAYSLRTVHQNLTSENPDIRFTPLIESGLYFGNRLMSITDAVKSGSVIEFDIDASDIPEVVGIEKGMLWLRINSIETIRELTIDNESWHYFDEHTIRLPTPSGTVHVRVVLGSSNAPRVVGTACKVIGTLYDGFRFAVYVVSAPGLNVTIRLFLPNSGIFAGDKWTLFSSAAQWNSTFDASSRVLRFWAVSDEAITFQVGPDVEPPVMWSIDQSLAVYNESVRIAANITDPQTNVTIAILSYTHGGNWVNVTMILESGLYVGVIPVLPYRTTVLYRLYASDTIGNWRRSEFYRYNVTDVFPPEIGVPEWTPMTPFPGESVTVQVSVSESIFASGVSDVTLWYIVDRSIADLRSVKMTSENGMWMASIPGMEGGRRVDMMIEAYDLAGNRGTRQLDGYIVKQGAMLPNTPLLVLILGLAAVGAVIGVGVYFFRFRRTKDRNMKKETIEKIMK